MKIDSKEEKILKLLYKELKLNYPPYHYKHIKIWTKYWALVNCLEIKIK